MPFKLEARDPYYIKIMNHLKEIIPDDPQYILSIGVPGFLRKFVDIVGIPCHFIEYYFCILSSILKTISSRSRRNIFYQKMVTILDFIEKCNQDIFWAFGFDFKLAIVLEKVMGPAIKEECIVFNNELLDDDDDERKRKAINFLYSLLGQFHAKKNERFYLKMIISQHYFLEKLKVDTSKSYIGPEFSDDSLEESSINKTVSDQNYEMTMIRDRYKQELMNRREVTNVRKINFEDLENQFIKQKTWASLNENLFIGFFAEKMYNHRLVNQRNGYISAVLLISLNIQLVCFACLCLASADCNRIQLIYSSSYQY